MMNIFSFFFKKKEKEVPSFFQRQFDSEEYSTLQNKLISFFEEKLNYKIEKIRDGIIYLDTPLKETQEDKFAIDMFLDIGTIAEGLTVQDYWYDFLSGFNFKTILNWKKSNHLISTCVIQKPMLQKKSLIYQWHSAIETEVYVLRLPHRLVQIPNDWLKIWDITQDDLKNSIEARRKAFVKTKFDDHERVGKSTPRPRRIPTDSTDFSLNMVINRNLKDKKPGMINDACPVPETEENYERTIRFTGAESIPEKKIMINKKTIQLLAFVLVCNACTKKNIIAHTSSSTLDFKDEQNDTWIAQKYAKKLNAKPDAIIKNIRLYQFLNSWENGPCIKESPKDEVEKPYDPTWFYEKVMDDVYHVKTKPAQNFDELEARRIYLFYGKNYLSEGDMLYFSSYHIHIDNDPSFTKKKYDLVASGIYLTNNYFLTCYNKEKRIKILNMTDAWKGDSLRSSWDKHFIAAERALQEK